MAKINANYEALYILDPALGEEEITALVEKFKGVVEANDDYTPIDGDRAEILGKVVAVVRRY